MSSFRQTEVFNVQGEDPDKIYPDEQVGAGTGAAAAASGKPEDEEPWYCTKKAKATYLLLLLLLLLILFLAVGLPKVQESNNGNSNAKNLDASGRLIGETTTEAPTTAAPTTEAPTTAAPTTEAPTTAAPTTEAPTTAAPTTEAPTTAAPTTEAPTTAAPTTEAPTTEAPTTESQPCCETTPEVTVPAPTSPVTTQATTHAPVPTTMHPRKDPADDDDDDDDRDDDRDDDDDKDGKHGNQDKKKKKKKKQNDHGNHYGWDKNDKNKKGIFALGVCSGYQSIGQIVLESVVLGFFAFRVVLAIAHYFKERGSIVLPSVWLEGFSAYLPLHTWLAVLWPFHVMSGPLQAAQALAHVSCMVFVAVLVLRNPLAIPFTNGTAMWAYVGIIAASVATALRVVIHHIAMMHKDADHRHQFHLVRKAQGTAARAGVAGLTRAAEQRRRAAQYVRVAEELERPGDGDMDGLDDLAPMVDSTYVSRAQSRIGAATPAGSEAAFFFEARPDSSASSVSTSSMRVAHANAKLPPLPEHEPCCTPCWTDCSTKLATQTTHFCGIPMWWLGAPRPAIMRSRPSPVTSVRVENMLTHVIAFALCLVCFVLFTTLSHNMSDAWCDGHVKMLNGAIFFAVLLDFFLVQPMLVGVIALFRYITSESDPSDNESEAIVMNEAYPIPYEWRYMGLPAPMPAATAAVRRRRNGEN